MQNNSKNNMQVHEILVIFSQTKACNQNHKNHATTFIDLLLKSKKIMHTNQNNSYDAMYYLLIYLFIPSRNKVFVKTTMHID